MAASTAVVTPDVYSIPEVVGEAASLHDPHDINAHVEAIERLWAPTNNDGPQRTQKNY